MVRPEAGSVARMVELRGVQSGFPFYGQIELEGGTPYSHDLLRNRGAIARPDDIIFAADLPKTRSGKIMRRLLRDIAEGKALGDTTTLADPTVVAKLKDQYESQE